MNTQVVLAVRPSNRAATQTNLSGGYRPLWLCLMACLLASLSATTLNAASISKANNADNLNLASSWSGGLVIPTNTDIAVWDSTVTGANTTWVGTNLTWRGLKISNPGGLVTINTTNAPGTNTLTIGLDGIDMSSATQDLTINGNTNQSLSIGAGGMQFWNVQAGRTLTVGRLYPFKQQVASDGTVQMSTTGTIKLGTIAATNIADFNFTPWATYGTSDWAALDGTGTVIPAVYTPATASITAGANNDIQGDFNVNTTIVAGSIRFNDATPHTIQVSSSATARTLTARGILVTPNCGGGVIGGNPVSSNVRMDRGSGGAGPVLYVIQNSAADFLISAIIPNNNVASYLAKHGPGNLVLSNFNTYTGGTFVDGGTLTLKASSASGSNFVNINFGRLAEYTGTTNATNATITFASGTTNAVWVATANGQAFVGSNFVQAAGGTSRLEFQFVGSVTPSTTAAPLVVGNLTNNTTTIDVFGAGFSTGVFPLIKITNNFAGSGFAGMALGTLPPRVLGVLSNDTVNKMVDLVITNVASPITWNTGDGTWQTSGSSIWKDAHSASTGYQEVSTPYGPLGDAVVFDDSSGGVSSAVTLSSTVRPGSLTINNSSKSYAISGSGAIAGPIVLVKTGSQALTLGTPNTFSGGSSLNGGTVTFSALNNLGSGAISFGGSTLAYSGNANDISVRTVTFGAGGGTIDTGSASGNVNYANPVGNNGAGGLTKAGANRLTLSLTNLYSGNTVITGGMLDLNNNLLAGPTIIPNSPAIVLSAGALFGSDDGNPDQANTLSTTSSQVLAGFGSVVGHLIVPAGTRMSPGTNGTFGTLTCSNNLTFGGTYSYDVSTTNRDLVAVSNSLTLNVSTLQVNAVDTLTNGLYPVFAYNTAAGFAGSVGNMAISGFAQAGKTATLVLSNTLGIVFMQVKTAGGLNDVWKNFLANGNWDVETSANWTRNGVDNQNYVDGDYVTFDDSVSPGTVALQATITPAGVKVNTAGTYTLTDGGVSGKITGASGITNVGSGTLKIETINNGSGPIVIQAGTVSVGGDGQNGDIGTGNVTNNGTIVFAQLDDRSVKGVVTGSGNLQQSGSGNLTLASTVNYTGWTAIGSGATLTAGTNGSGGALSTSTITNNGTLNLNTSNNWSYSGGVTGSGALVQMGSGTFTLSGANNYSGATTVSNGVFKASPGSLPFTPLAVHGGEFDMTAQDLNPNGLTGGSPAAYAGRVVNNTVSSVTNTLMLGTNGTAGDFSGTIADNDGGTANGKIRLLKIGAGTLVLRSNNTYSGGTHVVGGTLQVASTAGQIPGTVLLDGGTTFAMLQQNGPPNPTCTLQLAPSSAVSMDCNALGISFSGAVLGDNASTLTILNSLSFGNATSNQLQGFSGTVHVQGTAEARFSSTSLRNNGSDNATFQVDTNCTLRTRNTTANGSGVSLGALTGGGFVGGTQVSNGGAATYVIGLKGIDTSFEGTLTGINDTNNPAVGNQSATYVKMGGAKQTLDGVLLYDGQTTVSNGTLAIGSGLNNATSLTNSSGYQISAGGTLDVTATAGGPMGGTLTLGNLTNTAGVFITNQFIAGSGTLEGNLASPFGRVFPGDGIGTLTVSGTATLAGSMLLELNVTNGITHDELAASSINLDGCALTVTNLGPQIVNGTKFQLLNHGYTGTPASKTLPGAPYVWTDDLASPGDGSITLLSGGALPVNPQPTNITFVLSGSTLSLSWPTDHTGWRLLVQTNHLSSGLSGNTNDWQTVPGSTGMHSTNFPIDPAKPAEFYRMAYP